MTFPHLRTVGLWLALLLPWTAGAQGPMGPTNSPSRPNAAQSPFQFKSNPVVPPDTRVVKNLVYVDGDKSTRKLDLLVPTNTVNPPLIVFIHGGAFRGGSRNAIMESLWYITNGFAMATIDYRLSTEAQFPAQIEDCKAAVRYLRTHAREYGYNPDRIAAMGVSAGGMLACLLGVTGDIKEYETGANLDVSSRVQAVVDICGPTDLTTIWKEACKVNRDSDQCPEALLIGGRLQDNPNKAGKASPISYVTADDASTLIVHGDKDGIIPFPQAESYNKALKAAGVDVTLLTVKDGDNERFGTEKANVDKSILAFLEKTLKK